MFRHLLVNLSLIGATLFLGAILYPLALLLVGHALFPEQAAGSLLRGPNNEVVGSRLIAQPFTSDEYFQPRPSAASYNGAASGASNWGANNYQLRERVARMLGPIVQYRSGPRKGEKAAPDVEAWFQQDRFEDKPGIVARWAQDHNAVAQGWVKADKLNADYVAAWMADHPAEIAAWSKANPEVAEPKPDDLAVPFFVSYAEKYPGTFPSIVEDKATDGTTQKVVKRVKEGSDIQGIFFDMWRQEHADADLENVPADLVMASGSGLDPHITAKNALYQLDRVADAWAGKTKRDKAKVRQVIQEVLRENSRAPLGGTIGPAVVNVLELNLAVTSRLAQP